MGLRLRLPSLFGGQTCLGDCKDAVGPALKFLPLKLWFLGLGHLGQAYLWNAALLPYRDRSATHFVLQDLDRVVKGNWCIGLLCEEGSSDQYKTRVCSNWLEARHFKTRIYERPFDETVARMRTRHTSPCAVSIRRPSNLRRASQRFRIYQYSDVYESL